MAQYLPRAEIYVVTTPQAAAQRVAQRTAAMAKKLNLPVRGVIENMSWFTGDDGKRYELFGDGGGQLLADDIGAPLLGQIPLVAALREGGDDGEPITVAEPTSEASQAFKALAEKIVDLGAARVYRSELKPELNPAGELGWVPAEVFDRQRQRVAIGHAADVMHGGRDHVVVGARAASSAEHVRAGDEPVGQRTQQLDDALGLVDRIGPQVDALEVEGAERGERFGLGRAHADDAVRRRSCRVPT